MWSCCGGAHALPRTAAPPPLVPAHRSRAEISGEHRIDVARWRPACSSTCDLRRLCQVHRQHRPAHRLLCKRLWGRGLLRTVKYYLQAVGTVAPPSNRLCLLLLTCLSIFITRAAQITPPSCMRAGTQAAACLLYDTASVLSNQSAHRRRAASAALLRKPATPRSCSSSAPATRRTSRVPLAPAVAASPALCNGSVRAAVWLCWYFRMVQSKT